MFLPRLNAPYRLQSCCQRLEADPDAQVIVAFTISILFAMYSLHAKAFRDPTEGMLQAPLYLYLAFLC